VYVIQIHRLRRSLYVGQSALDAEERLANHLEGYKANRVVRRYGGRLRPDLYGHLSRFQMRWQAERAERDLATELRRRGWTVYGGH
jgi:hypothetical protein